MAQLEEYENILRSRRRNAEQLSEGLAVVNKKYNDPIQIPEVAPNNAHAWMMYPIVLNGLDKEPVMDHLNYFGIETRDMLPILSQPYYSFLDFQDYPVSTWLISCGFYVGCHQDLDPQDMLYILQIIDDYFLIEKQKGNGRKADRRIKKKYKEAAEITS